MAASIFDGCSDTCGWIAAVLAVLSFGSFGVPIKLAGKVEVHPLVMQSYKTSVCFLTCWLVILLGEEPRWTPYGIVSGLFWVPGAAMGIFGIRNAGLAVAVGTWSSITVLTSFFFGIIVFQERVKSFYQTCLAFGCLIIGLIGMSRFSAHQQQVDTLAVSYRSVKTAASHPLGLGQKLKRAGSTIAENSITVPLVGASGVIPMEIEPFATDGEDIVMGTYDDAKSVLSKDRLVPFGGRVSLTRRQMGILGAVVNGAWGGMNLIPLHFALQEEDMTGAGYLISYATGSLIVNTCIWLAFLGYYLHQTNGHWNEAVDCLPKWHFEHLLIPGLMAGLLYSFGNFCSILAVTYLGQGTGFSFCQMQLFVSGLWGVVFFKEVQGTETITKWFISASVAVVGIVWLAHEHEGESGMHRFR
jgi:glucose uptake protein GlcU